MSRIFYGTVRIEGFYNQLRRWREFVPGNVFRWESGKVALAGRYLV